MSSVMPVVITERPGEVPRRPWNMSWSCPCVPFVRRTVALAASAPAVMVAMTTRTATRICANRRTRGPPHKAAVIVVDERCQEMDIPPNVLAS